MRVLVCRREKRTVVVRRTRGTKTNAIGHVKIFLSNLRFDGRADMARHVRLGSSTRCSANKVSEHNEIIQFVIAREPRPWQSDRIEIAAVAALLRNDKLDG